MAVADISTRAGGRAARLDGALLGIALTSVVASIGTAVGGTWSLGPLDLSFLALLVGAYVGWTAAPTCIASEQPVLTALWHAVRATGFGVLGFTAVVLLGTAAGFLSGGPVAADGDPIVQALVETAFFLVLTAIYGAMLSLPITISIAAVATAVLRAGRTRTLLPRVTIATAGALATALAAFGSTVLEPIRSGDTILNGPVLLNITVANRSDHGAVVTLNDPDPATRSVGGSEVWVDSCSIRSIHEWESDDWFVSIETGARVEAPDYAGPEPSPFVGAADLPGASVVLWLDVAPNGTISILEPRTASPQELNRPPCD